MRECESKIFHKIEQKADKNKKITKDQSKNMLDEFLVKYPELLETCKRIEDRDYDEN